MLNFRSLEILRFIPPEELTEIYLSEVNQINIAQNAEIFGAEQLQSVAVLFELGGERYLLIAHVADYNGEWYIAHLGGNLGALLGLDPFAQGIILPAFVDEFLPR